MRIIALKQLSWEMNAKWIVLFLSISEVILASIQSSKDKNLIGCGGCNKDFLECGWYYDWPVFLIAGRVNDDLSILISCCCSSWNSLSSKSDGSTLSMWLLMPSCGSMEASTVPTPPTVMMAGLHWHVSQLFSSLIYPVGQYKRQRTRGHSWGSGSGRHAQVLHPLLSSTRRPDGHLLRQATGRQAFGPGVSGSGCWGTLHWQVSHPLLSSIRPEGQRFIQGTGRQATGSDGSDCESSKSLHWQVAHPSGPSTYPAGHTIRQVRRRQAVPSTSSGSLQTHVGQPCSSLTCPNWQMCSHCMGRHGTGAGGGGWRRHGQGEEG